MKDPGTNTILTSQGSGMSEKPEAQDTVTEKDKDEKTGQEEITVIHSVDKDDDVTAKDEDGISAAASDHLLRNAVTTGANSVHNSPDECLHSVDEVYPKSYVQCKKVSPMKSKYGKYRNAMFHFLPVRTDKKPDECPYESAGFFSTITFHWIQGLMMQIFHKGLEDDDIWPCPKQQSADRNCKRLERLWNEEVKNKGEKASFGHAVYRFIKTRILVSAFCLALHVLISFVGPAYFLRSILEYTQHNDIDIAYGVGLAIGLSIAELARSLSAAISYSMNYETGVQLRGAVLALVYQKVLRLRSLKDKSAGQLVNLFSTDAQRMFDVCISAINIISGPLISLVALVYLLFLLGPIVVFGFLVIFCFYPFQLGMSKLMSMYRRKAVAITDQRVRLMNEVLTCVKLIKMYAWEKPFARTIAGIREAERKVLEKSTYVQSMTMAFTPGLPITAAILTLIAHTLLGNDLSAAQAFTLLSVFNCVRPKLSVTPAAIKSIIEAKIAAKRYQEILMMEESSPLDKPDDPDMAIVFNSTTLAWDVQPYAKEEPKFPDSPTKPKRFISESEEMPPSMTPSTEAKNPAGKPPKNQNKPSPKKDRTADAVKKNGIKPQKCLQIQAEVAVMEVEMLDDVNEDENLAEDDVFLEEKDPDFEEALFELNLAIRKGSLVGICGSVGCGKSSMLAAVMAQMKLVNGSVEVGGDVAYVAQQAWIINATVKENIIFGYEWDEEKYQRIIEACSLVSDLESLPSGDETEIGERGINLSGGQKQRVSLARAVYSNRDIYLLDDPLSAVDGVVGHHIFHQCIKNLLKDKTVLLVTHQLHYLNHCSDVILMKDGRIEEAGKHQDLMALEKEYASMVQNYHSDENVIESTTNLHQARSLDELSLQFSNDLWMQDGLFMAGNPGCGLHRRGSVSVPELHKYFEHDLARSIQSITSIQSGEFEADGKLIQAETRARGKIKCQTYKSYVEAAGGFVACFFVLFMFFIHIGCTGLGNWWLSYWLSQGSGNTSITVDNVTYISDNLSDNPDMYFYNSIHGAILVAILITTCIRSLLLMKCTLHASSTLHDQLFVKVLRSPMSFFDTTPTGRVLNRFSKDIDDTDAGLPILQESLLQNIFLVILSIFMIVYVFPWFLIAVIPLIAIFYVLQRIFRTGLRELKRVVSVTSSPVFSCVTTTIQGLHTIKAYNKHQEYNSRFQKLLDKNTMPLFLHHCAKRWLTVRLDLVAITIILVTALLIVLLKNDIPTAYSGLALNYALMLIGLFQFTLRMAFETETHFTAVERIDEYIKHLRSEAPSIIKNNRPPKNWPANGFVKFENVRMKYRPGLPYVLRGINIEILPKEKVGIVGRTGSGKTSLGVALFRLVELSAGRITIDNVDIGEIGLEDLRTKLSIIPQDPVLFVGTIRYNLDPFNEHTDIELWAAVRKCHIIEMIRALPGRLDSTVVENGENFSVGERQLLCLARALLRQSKILMLDEATASIDSETDACVQQTIAESFSSCTILTVAHRLNTVLHYDRILVLKNGKVVEFDKPSVLLSRSNSAFSSMMAVVESRSMVADLQSNFLDR